MGADNRYDPMQEAAAKNRELAIRVLMRRDGLTQDEAVAYYDEMQGVLDEASRRMEQGDPAPYDFSDMPGFDGYQLDNVQRQETMDQKLKRGSGFQDGGFLGYGQSRPLPLAFELGRRYGPGVLSAINNAIMAPFDAVGQPLARFVNRDAHQAWLDNMRSNSYARYMDMTEEQLLAEEDYANTLPEGMRNILLNGIQEARNRRADRAYRQGMDEGGLMNQPVLYDGPERVEHYGSVLYDGPERVEHYGPETLSREVLAGPVLYDGPERVEYLSGPVTPRTERTERPNLDTLARDAMIQRTSDEFNRPHLFEDDEKVEMFGRSLAELAPFTGGAMGWLDAVETVRDPEASTLAKAGALGLAGLSALPLVGGLAGKGARTVARKFPGEVDDLRVVREANSQMARDLDELIHMWEMGYLSNKQLRENAARYGVTVLNRSIQPYMGADRLRLLMPDGKTMLDGLDDAYWKGGERLHDKLDTYVMTSTTPPPPINFTGD